MAHDNAPQQDRPARDVTGVTTDADVRGTAVDATGMSTDATSTGHVTDATTTGSYSGETVATGTAGASDAYAAGSVGTSGQTRETLEGDTIRVPVHEEELAARTRQVERGGVRVEKDVVAEERVLQVPVTEERVRVERHAVTGDQQVDPTAFQEGVISVPVRGEEVELTKSVRVAEEVEIAKEAVQRTEQVAGTVRREEVRVGEVQAAAETRTVEAQPAETAEVVRRTTVVEETDANS